jgi:hypothetical protein
MEAWIRHELDARGSLVVVKEDSDDFRLHQHVQVGMFAVLQQGMNVTVGRVLSLTVWRGVSQEGSNGVVGVKVA